MKCSLGALCKVMIYKAILVSPQPSPGQVPPSTDLGQDKHKWKQRQRERAETKSYLDFDIKCKYLLLSFCLEGKFAFERWHYNINGDVGTESSMNHVFKAVKS